MILGSAKGRAVVRMGWDRLKTAGFTATGLVGSSVISVNSRRNGQVLR